MTNQVQTQDIVVAGNTSPHVVQGIAASETFVGDRENGFLAKLDRQHEVVHTPGQARAERAEGGHDTITVDEGQVEIGYIVELSVADNRVAIVFD